MAPFRRTLKAWAAVWLLFQAAFLVAAIPRDCCDTHRKAAARGKSCHGGPTATTCPMRSATGAPCPMHAGERANGHADHTPAPHHAGPAHHTAPGHHEGPADEGRRTRQDETPAPCSMRGTCGGPIATLTALLSNHGVLPDSFVLLPDPAVRRHETPPSDHPIQAITPPALPPPRA
jgi:hypothetical protein